MTQTLEELVLGVTLAPQAVYRGEWRQRAILRSHDEVTPLLSSTVNCIDDGNQFLTSKEEIQ